MQLTMTPVLPVAAIISETTTDQANSKVNTLAISEESQVPEDANPLSPINLARLLASCGDCV